MGNNMYMYLILVHALLVKDIKLESGKPHSTEPEPITDFQFPIN